MQVKRNRGVSLPLGKLPKFDATKAPGGMLYCILGAYPTIDISRPGFKPPVVQWGSTPNATPTLIGGAFNCAGTGNITYVPSFSTSHIMSVEVWVVPTSSSNGDIVCHTAAGNVGASLVTWSGKFGLQMENPGAGFQATSSYTNNQLYHVVGTSDGSTDTIYINGKADGSTGHINTGSWAGSMTAQVGFGNFGQGVSKIVSVAAYNVCLSADQVKQLYLNPLPYIIFPQDRLHSPVEAVGGGGGGGSSARLLALLGIGT